jgi:WD40 repeat protein
LPRGLVWLMLATGGLGAGTPAGADAGACLQTLTGHTAQVYAVAVTPDGKRVVSGAGDNTLIAWDLDSGRRLVTLKGHTGPVCAVAVTPDGTRAVSGSDDKTLKVWDLSTGNCLSTLKGHTGLRPRLLSDHFRRWH